MNVVEKDYAMMETNDTDARFFPLAAMMKKVGHDGLTLFMKNVGFEEGPISPAATEGSCTTTDDNDSLDEFSSPPSTTVNSQRDDEHLDLVKIPFIEGGTRGLTSVSDPREASLLGHEACILPAFQDSASVIDDDPVSSSSPEQGNELDEGQETQSVMDPASLDPMKVLKKGAVAALGGTMVGVGLIMIPLPTPFGAVVASSGMAVLATEFEGAKELNDKIIHESKIHWKKAREKIVQGIEEMKNDDPNKTDEQSQVEESTVLQSPRLMNELEARRQDQLVEAAQKKKRPNFMDDWRKSTGMYLSKHLVPLLTSPINETGNSFDPSSDPATERTLRGDDREDFSDDERVAGDVSLGMPPFELKDQDQQAEADSIVAPTFVSV